MKVSLWASEYLLATKQENLKKSTTEIQIEVDHLYNFDVMKDRK